MIRLGPYVAVSIALVGFALFAAIHHMHLWVSRRERASLLFFACCVPAAGVCAAHAAVATSHTIAAGQLALELRTTFGLLTQLGVAWLIASISRVEASWYRRVLAALLFVGVLLNVFAYPLTGRVVALERITLPWGEELTLLSRTGAESDVFPKLLYLAVASVQVYALVGARALWPQDRTAASLMALAGCVGLVGSALGYFIDIGVLHAPYSGQLSAAVWIILMATLLSREHARRGERLEASEARLLASEARYRTLIESAPEAIVVLDVERECLVDVNQRACDLFGWSAAELTDLDPLALSPPAQPDGRRSRTAARPYFDQAVAGGSPVFEWVHRRRDGRDFPSEVRLVRLPDPVRALVRGTITDISERVQLQEQLRQAQKMEAIGQLAGGVAHDFNNLLTIISGYADLLHQQLDTADARRGLVEAIQEGSTRATWLTERLLAFSRRAALSPQTMDLNQVVLDTHAMLPPLTGKNIQLNVDLHEGRTRVRVDPGLWSQVLLNLVINARDAMPHGGRLDIATTAIDIDTSMATSDRPAGRYIQLSVTDSGDGMPPEVKSRVFEPFFTTKPVGKGTGLGLAVVHGIVRQAGGFIDVASTPGAGTTFVISVPAVQSDSHAGARDTSEPVSITPVGAGHRAPDRGTILLIENSDAVRQLIETTLHSQGFKVLVAHDEHDALRLLDAHDGAVDLLIKALEKNVEHRGDAGDSVLAGSRHSALTALYISDDVVTAPSPAEPTNGRHAFLQRPFSLDTLTHTVRELLTGRSEGRLDRGSR